MPRSVVRPYSGVYPIAIYLKPQKCRQKCLYCFSEDGFPESYLKNEDTLLAKNFDYDAKKQIEYFLGLIRGNKPNNQILQFEIIILGGTFSDYDKDYRRSFIKNIFDALNEHSVESLNESQLRNSMSFNRCSVLTIETRPDSINKYELDFLISLGVTKIELGVQSFDNDVLQYNIRNYKFENVLAATKDCKLRGLKVGYHIMVGLPHSDIEKEVELFNKHLWKECRPDYLKIYPFAFIGNKYHHDDISNFQYEEDVEDKYNQAIFDIKKKVPEYARISRIGRQINTGFSINRDLLSKKAKCKCIKCREPRSDKNISLDGKRFIVDKIDDDVYIYCLIKTMYVVGIARLFVCKERSLLLIREVRVFGMSASIGNTSNVQGRRIGRELVNEALKYAKKENIQNVEVLSSFGSIEFFKKLGFKHKDDSSPNLLFANRRSYYIGITEDDYAHVLQGNWRHITPKVESMYAFVLEVLEKLYLSELYKTKECFQDFIKTKSFLNIDKDMLSSHKPYEIKKSVKYRLGLGVYFVYDNFVIAYKYAKQKKKKNKSNMVILEVNLDSILDDSRYIYNLSALDGQYKFFAKSIEYKKNIRRHYRQFLKFFNKENIKVKDIRDAMQKSLQEVNIDTLIMDMIVRYDSSITGSIAIIQESQHYTPYANNIFNIDDNKTIRKIGGFTPYDHIEAVVYVDSLPLLGDLNIIKYEESEIEKIIKNYSNDFIEAHGLTDG